MNPEDEQKLTALSEKIADATMSRWQPQCVVRALLAKPVEFGAWSLGPITAHMWLLLDALRSPIVSGVWPDDAQERIVALLTALAILSGREITIEELIDQVEAESLDVVIGILQAMERDTFETALAMERPLRKGERPTTRKEGGMGLILPVYAFARSRMGMSHEEALDTPLPLLFALQSGVLWLDGLDPKGPTYAQKDAV